MDRCTLLFDIYEASIYKSMPFSIQRYRAGSSICLLFLHWSDKSQLLDPATEFWSLSLSGSLYEMVRDVCLCTRYYDPTRVWCVLYDRTGSPYMFPIHLRFHSFRFNQKRHTNIDHFSYREHSPPLSIVPGLVSLPYFFCRQNVKCDTAIYVAMKKAKSKKNKK